MRVREVVPTLQDVLKRLKPTSDRPACVVIAGGGVAGLEALIGCRTLAGDRLDLELISPERMFAWRSLAVAAAFGSDPTPSVDVGQIAHTTGATFTTDRVADVDAASGSLMLASGERREFDVLVVCIGATALEAIPGAITFGAPRGVARFSQMLEQAEAGAISNLVFALPARAAWPLGLYELALVTAERLQASGASVEITVLTPEAAPLAVFGGRASGAVLEELEDHGIHFVAGLEPEEIAWGELRARPGKVRINADVVVTLPRLTGPAIPGLPSDEAGFLPTDGHGLVRGTTNVYAAGDATAFPIKHGGLASQQADAAAEAIAAVVGVPLTPAAFHPILRGMLLTGRGPRYLEGGGNGQPVAGVASSQPLWWPPAKIAGRYLAPYLTGQVNQPPTLPSAIQIELPIDPEKPRARAAGGHR
jgi:sulfide:quinone oxidoreductase